MAKKSPTRQEKREKTSRAASRRPASRRPAAAPASRRPAAAAVISLETAAVRIQQGGDLAELRGLNDKAQAFIYAYASMHFQRGDYETARRGFRFLCAHKHREPDMWLALARSVMAGRDYREALRAYAMALHLRPSGGVCLEAARCCLALAAAAEAEAFLRAAESFIGEEETPLFHEIASLKREIQEGAAGAADAAS